jgi:hypothetical protein
MEVFKLTDKHARTPKRVIKAFCVSVGKAFDQTYNLQKDSLVHQPRWQWQLRRQEDLRRQLQHASTYTPALSWSGKSVCNDSAWSEIKNAAQEGKRPMHSQAQFDFI